MHSSKSARTCACFCVRINGQTGGGTGYFTDVRRVEPLLQLYTAAGHTAGLGTKSESHSLHTHEGRHKRKPSNKTERQRGFYREETIILNLYKQGGDPRQVSESVAVICEQFERSCVVVDARDDRRHRSRATFCPISVHLYKTSKYLQSHAAIGNCNASLHGVSALK